MKFFVFILSFSLIGCMALSDSDFLKMSHLSANDFVKKQWQYNIFETGNENIHQFHASFNDDQVKQPSENLSKLCSANGGVSEKLPLSEAHNLNVGSERLRSLAGEMAIFNELGLYEANQRASRAFTQEYVRNRTVQNALIEYKEKGYFSDAIKCKKDGRYIWQMSVIPGAPFNDTSGVSTLPIYLINIV